MTTVDRLDIAIHVQYARRMQFIEHVQQQYRLDQAATIPAQIQAVDLYPRLSQLDLLLGVIPRHAPWAFFYAPKNFFDQRRSPFAFHRVAPTLGSFERHQSDLNKIKRRRPRSKKEKKERETLMGFFEQIEEINDLIGYVVGRVGQFLKG